MVNWQLPKEDARWPVPHDQIADSGVQLHRGHVFFEVDRWLGNGFPLDHGLKYFYQPAKIVEFRF